MLGRLLNDCRRTSCTRQLIFQDASQRILLQPLRLQSLLSNLEITSQHRSRLDACVSVGSKVTVKECKSCEQVSFYLVGPRKAHPAAHLILILSPMGSAVLGCRRGARIKLDNGGRESCWEIIKINNK